MKARTLLLAAVALLALAGPALAQPNLIPNLPTGWAWPLVPRVTNDATLTSVPAPAWLIEGTPVYLNSAWRNIGTAASGEFHNNSVVDGSTVLVDRTCASLAAGAAAQGINGGPFYVLGGRHTLELRVDSGSVVTESSETDNNIAHQWSWRGGSLPAGAHGHRDEPPPAPQGGWSSIPAGQDKYDNCAGIGFTSGPGWSVVYIYSPAVVADYDLRLFDRTTNATDGYKLPLATSTRRGRGVEAAVVNGHNVGTHDYEIGVYRYAGQDAWYFEHVAAQTLAWGDSITVTFAQDEMIKAFDVTVPAAGPVSAWLQTTTTDPSVVLAWADRTLTVGGLTDLSANAATDDAGRARLDVTTTGAGSHAVVVFRDPDWGTGPRSFGVRVGPSEPDLAAHAPAGWAAPLVPRMDAAGTTTSVARPDTLPALNTGFYANWCVRNDGGAACPATSRLPILLDGVQQYQYTVSALTAGADQRGNGSISPYSPMPGRHTFGMHANSTVAFAEETRDNNNYAEQYCWAPPTLAPLGDMGWDPSPPALTAGFEDVAVSTGETFWYNCNGRRLPTAPSNVWWQGFIIAPLPGNDYDLQLHETLRGTKLGFAEPLAGSHWGSNQTDYVLVNLNATPRRPFDVGALNYGGTQSYHPQYVESTTMGNAGTLTLAPYESAGIEMMQLREWYFTAGYWIIHLKNLSYNDRYGLTLHQATEVYSGKNVATSVYPSQGGDCWLQVHVPVAGWCCVAVWAQDYDSIGTMRYQLSMSPGGTAVPETPVVPTVTALVGAVPNPFNPQTTVTFDLAATGHARLSVYGLRGELVRRLVDADFAAGRQQILWDGRDDRGRAVASGTYFARLEGCGVTQTKKLMLVR